MKIFKQNLLSILFVASCLRPSILMAQTDPILVAQQADCAKITSSEWSSKLNRCVTKVQAVETRNEATACNAIVDLTARADCHKALAEKKSGLSADPNNLNQGNIGKSAIMNGIGSAYAILGLINGTALTKNPSTCTSKTIFKITAVAGTATDLWLKARAKKKVDELSNKYKLETAEGAMDAQTKALLYLKEEQATVAEIAGMEKKRNMALMLGYGAASAMAIYEMFVPAGSASCYKKDVAGANKIPMAEATNTAPSIGGGTSTLESRAAIDYNVTILAKTPE
ncbi:MAG: hypothetical protein Q7U04_06680 [Bacteriovorax sp.]|nr:hypothetical protein [Bacteriovorax sp.]